MRIDFQGDQNIDLRSPYQRVWLAPGLRYRLELQVRFEDLTTDQGPYFEVVPERGGQPLATTPMLSGSSVWESIAAEFRAPEEQEPLLVRLRRLPSQRIDSLIQGTLWIDDVRLAQTSAEAAAVMTANYGKGEQASAGHP